MNEQHTNQRPDPLTTACMLAAGRVVIGVMALLMPRRVGRGLLGSIVDAPGGTAAVRTIGGRDLALGAGALIAERRGRPLRGWIEAGVLVDLLDCFVALFLGKGVPLLSRLGVLVLGGGAAAAGIVAANGLREPEAATETTVEP